MLWFNNFIFGLNLVFPCVLVCQFMIMTLKNREIILHKPRMKLNHNVIIQFVQFDFFSVHFHNDFLLAILAKCQALGATPGVLSKLML